MKNKESKSVISRRNSHTSSKIVKTEDIAPVRNQSKGPTISQINRIKKFYNTTRWLPNSSFTTFFGKPAFENYGYGNTNPVYGGLFYGNYMLSHNINPVDGENIPEEKQVYASAMLASKVKNRSNKSRKPEPPRKVQDEIRNTPDELKEIGSRNPIFQLNNNFHNREIIKPNLIKAKYFRSPKNSPKKDDKSEGKGALNEEFDVEGLIDGRDGFKKKKINVNKAANDAGFFKKEIKKKITKEKIDNKNPEYLKALKQLKDKGEKENQNVSKTEEQIVSNDNTNTSVVKEKMKDFYEKMLEDKIDEKRDEGNNTTFNQAQQSTMVQENDTTFGINYVGNSFRQRIVKKENPCLMPTTNIK